MFSEQPSAERFSCQNHLKLTELIIINYLPPVPRHLQATLLIYHLIQYSMGFCVII